MDPYDTGGASAARLADTLQDGCHLVCFGSMSGRPVTVPWTSFVSKGLVVKGFSLRQWQGRLLTHLYIYVLNLRIN